jgi:NAD(P)-dependent dehydrogenase (short-subunit alcohol dehydrogenase family)
MPDQSLTMAGKAAVITGASRGIGLAIARRFHRLGAHVLICSRQADAIAEAAESLDGGPGEVLAMAAHAADEDAAERCFAAARERWGGVDVLVNNAATNPQFGPTIEIDRRAWDKIVEVNLWAPLRWTQLAAQASLGRDGLGSVINISSNLAFRPGGPGGVYGLSKAALIYLTQQLATELGPTVRVNAIAPGVVETRMATALVSQGARLYSGWPLPRFGLPDDIASAAEFLASSASAWMTGQVLVVDGGAGLGTDPFGADTDVPAAEVPAAQVPAAQVPAAQVPAAGDGGTW